MNGTKRNVVPLNFESDLIFALIRQRSIATMNNPKGVSVVICTYNGAARLLPTFQHLHNQLVDKEIDWEILLIDNNSTDETAKKAQHIWNGFGSDISLRVVQETQAGVHFARHRGYQEAKYSYLIYVDDDNSLASNYIQTVWTIFESRPEVAVCVGDSELYVPKDFDVPDWWSDYQYFYAVGSQGEQEGILKERLIWTAGSAFRVSALHNLYEEVGHQLLLTGRLGKKQAAGEDSELGFSLQLLGYQIFYTPKLLFVHHIASQRITIDQLQQLNSGFGAASVVLDVYRNLLNNRPSNWQTAFQATLRSTLRKNKNLIQHIGKPKTAFIKVNLAYSWQRLRTLWAYRKRYEPLHQELHDRLVTNYSKKE